MGSKQVLNDARNLSKFSEHRNYLESGLTDNDFVAPVVKGSDFSRSGGGTKILSFYHLPGDADAAGPHLVYH